MTKEEALDGINLLLRDAVVEKQTAFIMKKLLVSGAIDIESYENNMILPKILLYVALRDLANSYMPPVWDQGLLKEIKKLERF